MSGRKRRDLECLDLRPSIGPSCLGLSLLVLTACGGVGTTEVVPEKTIQASHVSALTDSRLSARSQSLLRLTLLDGMLKEDPAATLRRLAELSREGVGPWEGYGPALAGAELALAEGRRLEAQDPARAAGYFLSAADLAHDVSSATLKGAVPVLSGQGRFAAELYNFSVGRLITLVHGPVAGQESVDSPLGPYEVVTRGDRGPWDADRFHLVHAAEIAVTGIDNRHRHQGLGAPLVASVRDVPERLLPAAGLYSAYESFFGLTGIARFPAAPRRESESRRVELELYDPLASDFIELDGLPTPLEADYTAPLAAFHEVAASRLAGASAALRAGDHMDEIGFLMLEPFREHKIPLILVHGLQSRSITWIEMANDLRADPVLRRRYQIFAFNYPTGTPFTISAALLQRHLRELKERLDPDEGNPDWSSAVIVGHSMGGLVTRMQLTETGDAFWNALSERSFDEVTVSPEDADLLRSSLFFEPVPWLSRAVFMATPHRGSRLAGGALGRMAASLVRVPDDLQQSFDRLHASGALPGSHREGHALKPPTVVESLHPDNPLFAALDQLPPRVPFHTVIADLGLAEDVTDGIVEGWSATLPGAASELTVPSTHGVHRQPAGIAEVRRILHEHLRSVDGAGKGRGRSGAPLR